MRLLLATPIYPPEIGGPAQYVKNLGERLKEKGIETKVVSYNNLKKYPQPFRFFFYFLNLFRKTKDSQIIYAFNLIGCGLPAFICSKLFRKKFIMRLGGDFLWERAVESGHSKKPLREYYEQPKNIKEKFWTYLIKTILNSAGRIVFTSNFQKEIYQKYFGIQEEKTVIIPNPFPEVTSTSYQPPTANYQILYAGRLIKLKNLDILIEVFSKIIKKTNLPLTLKIIGEGPEKENLELSIKNLGLEDKVIIEKPLSHSELLKEIQKSYLGILLSLTEISPNFALECIKLTKPILLTKETGIFEDFKDHLIFIDPQNEKDIEEKVFYLLNKESYQKYIDRIKKISTNYSWDNVIKKHLSLFKEFVAFA